MMHKLLIGALVLGAIWPFRAPRPRIEDSGINITIPPELKAQLQQILDQVSFAVYLAGARDATVAILLVLLVVVALVLLAGKYDMPNGKKVGLSILVGVILYWASHNQPAPEPKAPDKMPVKAPK